MTHRVTTNSHRNRETQGLNKQATNQTQVEQMKEGLEIINKNPKNDKNTIQDVQLKEHINGSTGLFDPNPSHLDKKTTHN